MEFEYAVVVISRSSTSDKLLTLSNNYNDRYFTKMELRDLFMLDNTKVSTTQRQIEELHSHQRKTDTSLDAHIAFLLNLGTCLFSQ